jgi:uncharacterized RDD family membrane protein YckC
VTTQPGWHPDPVPAEAGAPALLRYWDGAQWTEHTAPAQAPQGQQAPHAQTSQPAAYAGSYGDPNVYATPPWAGARPATATTPDGVPIASWGQRALAALIDGLVVGIIGAAISVPWLRELWTTYRDWLDDAISTSNSGGTFDTTGLQSDLMGPILVIGAIQMGVQLVYNVGFVTWKQATPGKLLVGLRIRLRERPGPIPFGIVLLRWLGQFGPRLLGLIPFVGIIGSGYWLLDSLWPLWDANKQTLHDKVAKTNVVRKS